VNVHDSEVGDENNAQDEVVSVREFANIRPANFISSYRPKHLHKHLHRWRRGRRDVLKRTMRRETLILRYVQQCTFFSVLTPIIGSRKVRKWYFTPSAHCLGISEKLTPVATHTELTPVATHTELTPVARYILKC